jgi:hypothetical protein
VFRIGLTTLLCLAVVGCSTPDAGKGSGTKPAFHTAYKPDLPLPKAEIALVDAVHAAHSPYAAAGNAKTRLAARAERAKAIRQALGGKYAFQGWIGTLADLSTTADGHAFVRIDMPETKISVGTWEDPHSDKHDRTLIQRNSRLYKKLPDLGIGTLVVVSGQFVPAAADFIAESSLNEAGTMKTPTFIARIEDIRPYK